jgi:hypothetical protein
MGKAPRRRRWLQIAGVVAAAYGGLWAATAAWGPDALRRWDHRRHVGYYTSQGWEPSGGERQLVSFSVPAPFIVTASWRFESRGPDGRIGSWSEGDVRAVWAFGWLRVVRDRMRVVSCG